jgi:hypothetical protein
METFEGLNWAVLKKVEVILQEHITFSHHQNFVDFNSISITSGQKFEEIPHIFESAGFRENEELTDAGLKWKKEVVLRIPKLRKEVSDFLDNYSGRKLVLLVSDMNDESFLVYPVRMTRQRNVPGQATGLNATEVRFYGESTTEAPTVTNLDTSP